MAHDASSRLAPWVIFLCGWIKTDGKKSLAEGTHLHQMARIEDGPNAYRVANPDS